MMHVQTTDAQAWWIALADEIRPREGLDGQTLFAEIAKAFNFSSIPQTLAKPGGGFEFDSGSFRDGEKLIIVNKISIYNDGVNVNVPTNTDDAEKVLRRLLAIVFAAGVREPTSPPIQYYLSTIVADFDKSLDKLLPASLLDMVSKALPYESRSHFLSVAINSDKFAMPARIGGINPTTFSIGRRVDIPYDMNRYFSQANATTNEHLAMLRHIESLA